MEGKRDPKESQKLDALCELFDIMEAVNTIVFCNRRETVDWLAQRLRSMYFEVAASHGQMPQELPPLTLWSSVAHIYQDVFKHSSIQKGVVATGGGRRKANGRICLLFFCIFS